MLDCSRIECYYFKGHLVFDVGVVDVLEAGDLVGQSPAVLFIKIIHVAVGVITSCKTFVVKYQLTLTAKDVRNNHPRKDKWPYLTSSHCSEMIWVTK